MSELAGFGAVDDMSPLDRAAIESARQDRREDLQAERAEAEKLAARESRLETLTFAEHQLGNPLAEMSRARSALDAANEVCQDLRDQLRRAEQKRDRARDNHEFFAQRAQLASEAARRSQSADGVEAAVSRAQKELAARQRVDAMLASASSPRERRPFGPGAEVTRNTPTGEVYCLDCITYGADAADSVLIHAAPGAPPPRTVSVPSSGDGATRAGTAAAVIYR